MNRKISECRSSSFVQMMQLMNSSLSVKKANGVANSKYQKSISWMLLLISRFPFKEKR